MKLSGEQQIWLKHQGNINAFSYTSDGGANWFSTLPNVRTNGMSFKDSIVYGFTNEGLWRADYRSIQLVKARNDL